MRSSVPKPNIPRLIERRAVSHRHYDRPSLRGSAVALKCDKLRLVKLEDRIHLPASRLRRESRDHSARNYLRDYLSGKLSRDRGQAVV